MPQIEGKVCELLLLLLRKIERDSIINQYTDKEDKRNSHAL